MEKQLIISVGREFGSGGHAIAQMLADRFSLPLYDRNLLDSIAEERHIDGGKLRQYDEARRNPFFSRTIRGFSNSPEDVIAQMQFDYMKKMAGEGKSFVVVGRCAETVLKGHPALISIFVLGDLPTKVERIKQLRNLSEEEARDLITWKDKKRKSYHNYHCPGKWGDGRNYDLSVNSSKLGLEKTAELLEAYILKRVEE